MKNKTVKTLTILSVIIMVIGIICWFLTNSLINEIDSITSLFYLFLILGLKLLIVVATIGIVAMIWLIYGIVVLWRQIKNDNFKWKNLIFIGVLMILVIIVVSIMIRLLNTSNENFTNNKFCLLYTSPSPRDLSTSRMPSSA